MKQLMLSVIAISAICTVQAQAKKGTTTTKAIPVVKAAAPSPFKNAIDSFSYAVGMNIGESMKQAGVKKLNTQMFTKAINDVMGSGKTLCSKEQANIMVQQTLQQLAKNKPVAKKVESPQLKEGLAFLAKNKTKAGVVALPNGLQYEILKEGEANGEKPKKEDQVSVNYIGTLINGTEFDNSYKRGEPATFPLMGVIRGWTEILQLMPKGAKWKVYIPSEMAYGENPPSPQIPPSSVLIFEIELLNIIKAGAATPAGSAVPVENK
jgi:FKBP-type peptidyl-prolyl cis-trans isomerase FklB